MNGLDLRIATCRPLPEPDPDEELLLGALADAGVAARMAAWNDPSEDWDVPVPTVIRSTWDYIHDPDLFLTWVDRAAQAASLWNPPAVIRANVHKRYLVSLAQRGIPVAPTALINRGERVELALLCADNGWGDVVVKPAIGAASFGTERFSADARAAAQTHLDRLVAVGDALVQPYLASVAGTGERSLVAIDGALSHAVRKSPRFSDGDEHVSDAIPIADDERALAERVLETLPSNLLYARVDLARDDAGRPLLMELELIEPSLFLLQSPPALDRLVGGLVRRLARRRT